MKWETILQEITKKFQVILKDNLVGIYLHGSVSFGCATDASDIDFIVVVKEPLRLEEKEKIISVILKSRNLAPAKGLEMSIVLQRDCRFFSYPTPYQLHYSPMHQKGYKENLKEYCNKMQGVDYDLAAHFMVIKKNGIVLCGKEVDAVFCEVPFTDYLNSIWRDVCTASEDVLFDPVSVLLNLCRVWAAFEEQKVLSKPQGADWALPLLPSWAARQVMQAKVCYQQGVLWNRPQDGLEECAKYLIKRIQNIRLKL